MPAPHCCNGSYRYIGATRFFFNQSPKMGMQKPTYQFCWSYSLNTYKCHNGMSLPFYNQFWSFFWPLCNYVSQNLGADSHFVALNLPKSELDQRLQHKFKTFLFPLFSILEEKILKIYDSKMGNFLSFLVIFCQLHENLSQN